MEKTYLVKGEARIAVTAFLEIHHLAILRITAVLFLTTANRGHQALQELLGNHFRLRSFRLRRSLLRLDVILQNISNAIFRIHNSQILDTKIQQKSRRFFLFSTSFLS